MDLCNSTGFNLEFMIFHSAGDYLVGLIISTPGPLWIHDNTRVQLDHKSLLLLLPCLEIFPYFQMHFQ